MLNNWWSFKRTKIFVEEKDCKNLTLQTGLQKTAKIYEK